MSSKTGVCNTSAFKTPKKKIIRNSQPSSEAVVVGRRSNLGEALKAKGVDQKLPSKYDHGRTIPHFEVRLSKSNPFRLFYIGPQPNSVTLQDILSKDHISALLIINYIVDVKWIRDQLSSASQRTDDITIVASVRADLDGSMPHPQDPEGLKFFNVRSMPYKFGTHHAKMIIIKYDHGGVRVVVTTANMKVDDWNLYVNGLWVSPLLSRSEDGSGNPDSATNFRKDSVLFLRTYEMFSHDQPFRLITRWMEEISILNCVDVNVYFVASVPGKHQTDLEDWGHCKLRKILISHNKLCHTTASQSHVVAQCSAIGSLGGRDPGWLSSDFLRSTGASGSLCNFHLIYPTAQYVQNFIYSAGSGASTQADNQTCLSYSRAVHAEQSWLTKYLCKWVPADSIKMPAIPHLKTYASVDSEMRRANWFLLTSANMSQAAWGSNSLDQSTSFIKSFEAGVLFIPECCTDSESFSLVDSEDADQHFLQLPYKLLLRYLPKDEPFLTNSPPDFYKKSSLG
ncbi:unnamed protein product [Ceutorhynchus assimilis]|uniref:Tyrosyl-DNA phosphodiesterase n=1 Tax=Ceutorhynchus assimilis TaxID=467358 RepID=A0A9N9MN39_9CUCU|nr:unnamed protein product [Ceutorhynchus assimilis]